jgi:hypothetical protein
MQTTFIKKETFTIYSGKCLSCKAVHNWVETVSQGCSKVANDARPGRPVEIATEATVQQVEELIRADRRITIDNVATALGCSYGLTYSIKHVVCSFGKCVCMVGAQRTEGSRKNELNGSVLATSLTVC